MRVSTVNHRMAALLLTATAVVTSACGEVARTGRSPAYLQIVNLEAASGAEPDKFGNLLFSDVVTVVKDADQNKVATIYADNGRAEFKVGLKDPGPTGAPTTPSSLNAVTLSQYRVVFKRSDGRNTQGVDVPYAFDGGMTITVPASGSVQGVFALVRHQAKEEAPLRALAASNQANLISTVAEITFYGKDQTGNDVQVTGMISVNFGNFGDPQ